MKRIFNLTILFLFVFMLVSPVADKAAAEEKGRAKNVILILPDGMGFGPLSLLINYAYQYKKEPLSINQVMKEGDTGYCVTTPVKYIVPEGCSGITSIATGKMSLPLVVSMDAEGRDLKTIIELAKEKGYKTGVITTNRVSHYTAGSFLAHAKKRNLENDIAAQEANSGVDVLMGGGLRHWIPKGSKVADFAKVSDNLGVKDASKRDDDRNLIEEAKGKGYEIAFTQDDLSNASANKLIGLFASNKMPFNIDLRSNAGSTSPTISQMTKKAIDILSAEGKGFLLVVTDGLLAQLLHENDPAGTLAQLIEVDEAVKVALDFKDKNPDTLVVIASSRDVGGVAFSAHQDKTLTIENDFGIPNDFAKLELQRKSSNALFKEMGKDPSSRKIKSVISGSTAYDLSNKEAMWIKVFPEDEFFPKYMGYPYGALGKIIGKKSGIVWVSQYNTALMTPLFGMGPGAQGLKGVHKTTDIFNIIKEAIE